MTSQLPSGVPPAGADGDSHLPGDDDNDDGDGLMVPAAGLRPAGCLIAVMLVAAAALDLARCGIVVAAARHVGPDIGLVSAGLAAAALSLWAARGCRGGRRWSVWAALLIGAASAPQAAMSGFRAPYTIPDTATAVLGVLLAVAVLATAGRTGQPGEGSGNPFTIGGAVHPMTRSAPQPAQARGAQALPPAAPAAGARPRRRAPVGGGG